MALDTRGLAHGFTQGFGMADRYYARQEQGERADRRLDMQEETFDMQKQQAQRAQNKETATFVFGKIANKMDLSDEEMQWLKDNPNYLAALNPQADQALEVAQRVIDPQDPTGLNDDEGLYALNTLFEPMINRGKGGGKRIVAGLPGQKEGTMAFELEVEGEDGKRYRAPMTTKRGVAGEDDEILQVPVEDLVNTAQGYRVLRNAINTSGASENAAKLYSLLTGKTPERTKGVSINDRLVNPETGEVMADFSGGESENADWRRLNDGSLYNQRTGETKEAPGGAGSSGKAPADVKTAEWMMSVGLAENYDQAWSLLSESRTDPTRFVANYVDQEMKAQEQAGLYPDMDGYKTTAQMRDDAIKALQAIRQSTRGTGEQQSGAQEPRDLELTGSDARVLPSDGSAVQNGDGSYSGRVNRNSEQPEKKPANPAPTAAVDHLKKNPQLAEQFKAKYNYLPEGF